jgi:hypothetical protein
MNHSSGSPNMHQAMLSNDTHTEAVGFMLLHAASLACTAYQNHSELSDATVALLEAVTGQHQSARQMMRILEVSGDNQTAATTVFDKVAGSVAWTANRLSKTLNPVITCRKPPVAVHQPVLNVVPRSSDSSFEKQTQRPA